MNTTGYSHLRLISWLLQVEDILKEIDLILMQLRQFSDVNKNSLDVLGETIQVFYIEHNSHIPSDIKLKITQLLQYDRLYLQHKLEHYNIRVMKELAHKRFSSLQLANKD